MSSDLEAAVRDLLKAVLCDVVREVLAPRLVGGSDAVPGDSSGEPLLLRAPEAAKLLAISESQLFKLTKAGTIPCVRVGRLVRYSPNALREWVSRSESVVPCDHTPPASRPPARPTSANVLHRTERRTAPAIRGTLAANAPKSPIARKASEASTPAPRRHRASPAPGESKPRNILAFFASRLGVDEAALPRMTNGEIMRIAEVDIPTLHGWTYRNRDMPETAMNRLHDYFVAYLSRKQ